MTEQQTAPAKANREYRARPVGAVGSAAASLAFAASTLLEPVAVGGGEVAISLVWTIEAKEVEWRGLVVVKMDRRRLESRDS